MNAQWAKKHILERLAHGVPIQTILNPRPPKITVPDVETNEDIEVDDPNWTPPDLPDWNRVVEWLKDEAFRREWEHARKAGAAYNADELLVLKNLLREERDPRMASKYKVMMEMIQKAAAWGDSKFAERSIQENINTAPQAPEVVLSKINQLRRELGLPSNGNAEAIDVQAKEVKQATPAQLAHREKLRALAKARKGKPRVTRTTTGKT